MARKYKPQIKIHRTHLGEYAWVLEGSNGHILAESNIDYSSLYHCRLAIKRLIASVAAAEVVESAKEL